MIIVRLTGGLGNQMFQFAFGKALSLRQNTELVLDPHIFFNYPLKKIFTKRKYELYNFNIRNRFWSSPIISKLPAGGILNKYYVQLKNKIQGIDIIIQEDYCFNNKYLYVKDNSYLVGTWQSYKFFEDYHNEICKIYNNGLGENNDYLFYLEMIKNSNSISLHVRRGDYVNNRYHPLCSQEYYMKAIKYIKRRIKEPKFFIFSDDLNYVKNNFTFLFDEKVIHIINKNKTSSDNELRLMSKCKHNIIANSSYSWWGAYLNLNHKKIVIYPKVWLANQETKTADLFPSSWVEL